MQEKEIKEADKERYSQIVQEEQGCQCTCCGPSTLDRAEALGYSIKDLKCIPDEAILGLGCGNPVGLAELKPGEVVLDLGSGAGIDVFLAANKVGPQGKAIGVDMTEEMVQKAQSLAQKHGYDNIEFRLGEIEALPIEDDSIDIIISNCVINLAPDKSKVFREAHRVLKPGGRLVVSDIVTEGELPQSIRQDLNAWSVCVAGAEEQQKYLQKLETAGFTEIQVTSKKEFYFQHEDEKTLHKILSVTVKACKSRQ